MQKNVQQKYPTLNRTYEGAAAAELTPEQQLRRSVLSCLLWENSFYEDGDSIADRITRLADEVDPTIAADLAIDARGRYKLRHVPLLIARQLARNKDFKVASLLEAIIQRPDEIAEFIAIYWKDKREPLSAQVKKGLAKAFLKFSEYQFAKYKGKNKTVSLRDALFLCHAKPFGEQQSGLFRRIADDKLETPETWEVMLSAGKDKKSTFEYLLNQKKLGGLALLRNLRNMKESGVDPALIKSSLYNMDASRILPYRFIAAHTHAPEYTFELERAMFKSIANEEKLSGSTVLLVDVSGSMDDPLSSKSDLTRLDAACGLAMLARELCTEVDIYTFSYKTVAIKPSRGFALKQDIVRSQTHGGTHLREAINYIENTGRKYARIIIITDEQSASAFNSFQNAYHRYMINVAAYKNGIGFGPWTRIDGFSEAVVQYMVEYEKQGEQNE